MSCSRATERARLRPGPLRLRATRAPRHVAASILMLALLVGCGGSSSRPEATSESAAGDEGGPAARNRAAEVGGEQQNGGDESDREGSDRDELTAAEICRRIAGSEVADALGVDSTEGSPSTSATPQCSYVFATDGGGRSDATVAVLRTNEDLEGREGRDAFDYVVKLNRDASRSELDVTEMSIGDRAVLISGNTLHFGVVQLGTRIVTTIVSSRVADAKGAIALSRLTSALAP